MHFVPPIYVVLFVPLLMFLSMAVSTEDSALPNFIHNNIKRIVCD